MTTEHQISYNAYDVYSRLLFCACDRSVQYTEAGLTRHLLDVGRDEGRQEREALAADDWRDGYDVGLAAAKGEPVTADDPRIKPGARARVEFDTANGVTAHESVVAEWDMYHNGDVRLTVATAYVQGAARIYLLAEAPDPDAEVREALEAAAGDSCTYAGMLDALRAAGYDVVKAVAK